MRKALCLLLLVWTVSGARAGMPPGGAPVVQQQPDGLIVLNPGAAAFVMTDNQGRHVMNGTDPRLRIEGGRIVNPGERFQFPGWHFQVARPGKFEVYLDADTRNSEDCSLRLSFYQNGKEGRVIAHVPAKRNDEELVPMGEMGLGPGEYEVSFIVSGADNARRLPALGNIMLVPVAESVVAPFLVLAEKSPLARTAEAVALESKLKGLQEELKLLQRRWDPKADSSKFETYAALSQWISDSRRIQELQAEADRTTTALLGAQAAGLRAASDRLPPAEQVVVEAYVVRDRRLRERAAKLDKPVFNIRPAGDTPLYPVGGLDKMQPPSTPANAPVIEFEVPPPDDAAIRRRAFARRNTPEGLAETSRSLHAALRPDVRGLELFYKEFAAGRHAEALEAYRDFFFRKLKSPEKYGAGGVNFVDDFFQKNGKAMNLRPPNPDILRANLKGKAVLFENNTLYFGNVGEPGAVSWAPATLQPPGGAVFERGADGNAFWKSSEGKLLAAKIQFFRRLNRQPGQGGPSALFPDLLYSYAFTGNREHLGRYAAYLDDWSANSVNDVENCPVNIRAATELEVIGWYRTLLRIILDERPELARDYPAPSLARLVLALTESYHPYIIRAKRAEIANWGIMGVEGGLNDSRLLNEFRSMDYSNRELSRLARINFIQHLSLDGEDLESWDEGHVAIDGMMDAAPKLGLHGAPVLGDLEAGSLADHAKTMQRALLTHFSPDGNYWIPWTPDNDVHRATIRGKIIPRGFCENVLDETEPRRRFNAALGKIPAASGLPVSDLQPYSQMAYLRDGFGRDASSLLLQNFPVRSQNQGWTYNGKRGHIIGSMRTQYSVARDAKSVLEATPILVDSKPPNFYTDLVPTGGKTDYCFQTPRQVQPGRFLSSGDFDVVESIQDSPYRRYKFEYREILGLISNTPDEPIRDVRAVRQVVHLRNEGIFIIGDRVENKASREFTQMFIVPARVPSVLEKDQLRLMAREDAVLLEVEPRMKRVRSLTTALPNVSFYIAGHDFTWGGRSTGENAFAAAPTSVTAKAVQAKAASSKEPERTIDEYCLQTLSVRWKGEGNQALASVVLTRPARMGLSEVGEGELEEYREMNGAGGVSGFSFRTAKGAEVWFQMAPAGSMSLKAGPGEAQGGSLLVVKREGVFTGVVMDGSAVTLEGKSFKGPSGAFEFRLEKDGKFLAVPVRAPIDTVVVSPQQTVFTEKVKVSFEIPTQKREDIEYRYTLDGSDPTLESALYKGPFELDKDTLVKVRPFLKGLKQTPWNIAGVEGGKTVGAVFRKTAALPAAKVAALEPGLGYEYFEDSWTRLVSHSGMYPLLPVKSSGKAVRLLDVEELGRMRKTDRAFGVKYEGYIDVPAGGVYRFFAPEPLYNTTKDAGYELRIWIDGQEWFPNPDLHAENIWSVALEKGLHRFQASYVDYRWKTFRNEYWMGWKPEQMWEGVPVLEVDGPGLPKQALPTQWLIRKGTL